MTCLSRSAAAVLALALAAPVARADGPRPRHAAAAAAAAAAAPGPAVLEVGAGRVFRTSGAIASLFAADPKVVEVRPVSRSSVFIFGLGIGRSSVTAFDEAGNMLAHYDIVVRPSSFGTEEAAAAVSRAVPGAKVEFSGTPDGMVVSGEVPGPTAAEQVAMTARSYAGEKMTVDNRTNVTSSVQVTLRVRIAEISRNITRQLGINWNALANIGRWGLTGVLVDSLSQSSNAPTNLGLAFKDGVTSINTVLDLLAQDQLINMLAEPNLTTRSGETASFLAGGEFPIPVSGSNGSISVAFKQYGVSLAFVPTVLSDGRISLHVHPEVSQLATVGSVSVPITTTGASVTIPALTVRRADTTVELGSGQSFAVAGLLQSNGSSTASGLPYASEIPVIGALFKSSLFQRGQSELVIVVTPYIVRPVNSPSQVRVPTDGFVSAGDIDSVLLMRQRARGTGPGAVVVPSATAFGPATRLGPNDVPAGAGFILH